MAIINLQIELDWIDPDGSIDDEIKSQVISKLQDRLTFKAEQELKGMMEAKLQTAAEKVTDEFLLNLMAEKIETVQIPHKESAWGSEVEMLSVSEFVGRRYERFLQGKSLTKHGEVARYSSDADVSVHEYFTNQFLQKELLGKVAVLIKTARQDAEEQVIQSLESNLKAQLSADIINRLNIPSMLKSLQEKAALFESGSNES